jgi:hypothetical protein
MLTEPASVNKTSAYLSEAHHSSHSKCSLLTLSQKPLRTNTLAYFSRHIFEKIDDVGDSNS